jgi:hypothetical protein
MLATLDAKALASLPAEVRKQIEAIQAQNEALTKAVSGDGNFRVGLGKSGTIVIQGFGRYPHTFYREQWDSFEKYLKGGGFDTIRGFITANLDKLSSKAQKLVEAEAATNGNGNNGNGTK